MKKLYTLLITLLLVSFSIDSYAVQKIVMLKENKDISMAEVDINNLGGKIVKHLDLINAVVVDFPDYIKDGDIYALDGVENVEDDLYLKWIEETTLPELPSVEEVSKNIKNGNYDYTLPSVSLEPNKATDEELKEMPWGIKRVNAYKAWNFTTGKSVKVAVIDTGIDYTHPDLKKNYVKGYNAIDPSKSPLDDQGHGTHVAGTIGAVKNLRGVVGVAPEVSLYAVKVLDSNGSGRYSWIIDGIQWAVKNKMNIINMSLGGRYGNYALEKAVKKAYESGIVVVCAAGNDGGSVNYPAKYKGAIAVSALNTSDGIAYFSSRGPEIAFIAPGVRVKSTYKGGGYKTASGTSMASPHVAGLAALVVGMGIDNPDKVKEVLAKSSVKLGLKPTEEGNGLIDASKIPEVVNSLR